MCGLSTVDRAVGVEKGRDVAGNGFESDGVEEKKEVQIKKERNNKRRKEERKKEKEKQSIGIGNGGWGSVQSGNWLSYLRLRTSL